MFAIAMVVILMIWCSMIIRNEITSRNRLKIIWGIGRYNIHVIEQEQYNDIIDFDCLEPYDETLFRLWDFGYTRVIPKEQFDKIKDFIK